MLGIIVASLLTSGVTGVVVDADRIRLQALLHNAPEPWASLDMGASPAPGESVWVDATTIRRRVAQAQLEPLDVQMPRRTRVVRSMQRIDEVALRHLVEDALFSELPRERVRAVVVRGGVVMPKGPLAVRLDIPATLHDGWHTIMASVESSHGHTATVPVTIHYAGSARDRKPLIERGHPVTIRLHHGAIVVEAAGIAQESGHVDSVIAVLPNAGTKMLHARVLDARYVELQP